MNGDFREFHRWIAQTPIPVHHQIALELGQAQSTELHAQVQIGVDTEIHLESRLGVGQDLIERQLACRIALQINVQGAAQTAALMAWRIRQIAVNHRSFKEQQLAASFKSGGGIRICWIAIEQSRHIHAQLGHIGLIAGIGAQEETFGRRQTKAKVIGPIGRQREPTVDIQGKTWQINVQR